ncbi:MAG: hypothetical protein Fur0040_00430 [Sideroxydans sp.]
MKKLPLNTLLLALLAAPFAQASSQFAGPYFGINLGQNTSSQTALSDKKEIYPGAKLGYNADWGNWLIGVEGLADLHGGSYTGNDLNLDGRLGLPMDRWMPYVKLGLAATAPGSRRHMGLGLEYSLTDDWSLNAEYATDKYSDSNADLKNSNISLGLNGFFGGSEGKSGAAAQRAAAEKAAAEKAAAERAAAERAAAEKAAAERAAAERAAAQRAAMTAAEKAAADKAAAEAAARAAAEKAAAEKAAAQAAAPAYKTLMTDKPVVLEGANFATGSAKLNPSAYAQLDDIVRFAADNPNAGLTIIGYTDNRGRAASNMKLSAARAAAVKEYLVGKGVASDRISTQGMGSANPVGDNNTEAGRAQNRRVEIKSVITEVRKVRIN